MRDSRFPTGPALFAESPPGKKEAAPCGAASSGEHEIDTTTAADPQTVSPLERTITLFQNVTETEGSQHSIGQCLALIRDDQRLAKMVAALRPLYWTADELRLEITDDETKAAHQAATAKYDRAKKRLPAITLSGTFTKRAIDGLACYSNVLQADLDHLERVMHFSSKKSCTL